ncbi:MAG: hypothetical protein JWO05_768 [Gemmatimonadetes bacterium]|nr:hypothetical protein [Gemmatimonadota bacterium]
MISFGRLLRGTVTRFVPGAAAFIAVVIVIEAMLGATLSAGALGVLSTELAALGAGHLIAMLAFRRRLRSDAPVTERPTAFAGAAAAVSLLVILALAHPVFSLWAVAGLSTVAGAAGAIGSLFPWFRRQREVDALSAAQRELESGLQAASPIRSPLSERVD